MENHDLLRDLLLVLSASIVVVLALHRLRLPTIAGLLVAGAAIGPSGLGWIEQTRAVAELAEVGVVLLLFSIGLEFSLASLRRIARMVAVGGALQVSFTLAATYAVALAFGRSHEHALFFGFLAALSSTAIVLRGLAERREVEAPHGRLIVGVLLFQDLCVVPMMLVTPMLAAGEAKLGAVALALGKALAVMAGTIVLARFVVPPVFRAVARTQRRDVFLLAVVLVCASIAWATAQVGLSLALGAFLAGVVLADSEFSHQALSDVLPLRDLFTSLFFVSVGTLLDLELLAREPLLVFGLAALLLLGKFALAALAAVLMRLPLRVALLSGAALAQVGEFSFVLADLGGDLGLLSEAERALFLGASVLTMLVTPGLLRLGPHLAAGAAALQRVDRLLGVRDDDVLHAPTSRGGHVVVLGYGVGGALLARALRAAQIESVIVDLDLERVRSGRAAGESIGYGDATSAEILEHVGVARSSRVAVMLNDPQAAHRAIRAVRSLAPNTPIYARAHDLVERERLLAAGATHVAAQEVEASLQVLEELLRDLRTEPVELQAALAAARAEVERR
ncbi:MAG: cation:proton antiporter [Planctomycetes bacterium]|nr:cation:proton antiporter [Planctomycetota bacterium]